MNIPVIQEKFKKSARVVLFSGDCLDLLATVPDGSIQLLVTSPPYNLGKEYEKRQVVRVVWTVWRLD